MCTATYNFLNLTHAQRKQKQRFNLSSWIVDGVAYSGITEQILMVKRGRF